MDRFRTPSPLLQESAGKMPVENEPQMSQVTSKEKYTKQEKHKIFVTRGLSQVMKMV
jgi:hypothetical protein